MAKGAEQAVGVSATICSAGSAWCVTFQFSTAALSVTAMRGLT
jgi:hypothetical protein